MSYRSGAGPRCKEPRVRGIYKLYMVGGAVTDSDGLRVFVACEVVQCNLIQILASVDGVDAIGQQCPMTLSSLVHL
jgi:hypothetical protein